MKRDASQWIDFRHNTIIFLVKDFRLSLMHGYKTGSSRETKKILGARGRFNNTLMGLNFAVIKFHEFWPYSPNSAKFYPFKNSRRKDHLRNLASAKNLICGTI